MIRETNPHAQSYSRPQFFDYGRFLTMHEPTATPLARTRSQLSADFRDLDQLYSDLYNRCSREQLLWQPPDGSWSMHRTRCTQHLAIFSANPSRHHKRWTEPAWR
jgi:hypothetical protein